MWDKDTGLLTRERYYHFGDRHREGGPSSVSYHPLTGEIIGESWDCHNALNRTDGGPALWRKDPETGVVVHEEYWENGVKHRDGGAPAAIWRDKDTGQIVGLEFYEDGDLIREEEAYPSECLEP